MRAATGLATVFAVALTRRVRDRVWDLSKRGVFDLLWDFLDPEDCAMIAQTYSVAGGIRLATSLLRGEKERPLGDLMYEHWSGSAWDD